MRERLVAWFWDWWPLVWRVNHDPVAAALANEQTAAKNLKSRVTYLESLNKKLEKELDDTVRPLAKKFSHVELGRHPGDRMWSLILSIDPATFIRSRDPYHQDEIRYLARSVGQQVEDELKSLSFGSAGLALQDRLRSYRRPLGLN